jgi:eukaryotic-like serine/threonine-protein kinase
VGDGFVLAGTVFEGRFRIEERIAEGGFAVVYRAVQVALERRVALKVLKVPRSYDEAGRAEFRDRFATEAKVIASIRHPHIVDVYDFSVSTLASGELAPWMALEWLEGETLAAFLAARRAGQDGGLPAAEAVELVRPAIEALAYAHSRGIAHRDVKPANIMVARTPKGTSVRVLDFGIAKILSDETGPSTVDTRTESAPAFSPFYAAPEQVTFSRTGAWTDVHALGLILSELMTGEPPFGDQDPESAVFEHVMAARRPTPAAAGRDVGALEPVIAKALALAPRDRWKNAGELLAALDDARATSPVVPAPSRRRGLVTGSVLGAAALAGAIMWGVSAHRAPSAGGAPRASEAIASAAPRAATVAERPIVAPPPVAAMPTAVPSPASVPPAAPERARDAPPARRTIARKRPTAPAARPVAVARPAEVKQATTDGTDLFDDTK